MKLFTQIDCRLTKTADVFHGTPKAWNDGSSPDLKMVGTGRGLQSHGWGTYFTEDPGEAEVHKGGDGQVYRFALPDIMDKLLKWNATIAEQPPSVAGAARPVVESAKRDKNGWISTKDGKKFEGSSHGDLDGREIYLLLTIANGGSKQATSEYLASIGVPGCSYVDNGVRNYVIWDQSILDGMKAAQARQAGCRTGIRKTASIGSEVAVLAEIASQSGSYEDFLKKVDGKGWYDVLYRGHSGDSKTANIFATDYYGHAKEYGDQVDGYVYSPSDVLFFNEPVFREMKNEYGKMTAKQLSKIYKEAFSENRLDEAMYMGVKKQDEKSVLGIVAKTLRGEAGIDDISMDKYIMDLMIPVMQHHATSKGKKIIGFLGGDYAIYGGQNEYVISDVSGMPRMTDIWNASRKSVKPDDGQVAAIPEKSTASSASRRRIIISQEDLKDTTDADATDMPARRGTRFTVNGRGLLNNQSLDYDKLDDDEMEEVEFLLSLGLEQPRGVPAGAVFYFTDEGLRRHSRLIELLMKAAKSKVDTVTINLPHGVVWESDDGQVAVAPGRSTSDPYMDAVTSGDMETAQKMVDEAAKKAGYTIGPVKHGTASKYTVFDRKMGGKITDAVSARSAFFFVDDDVTANAYAAYAAEEGPIKELLRKAEKAEKRGDWDSYDRFIAEAEQLDTYDKRLERRGDIRIVNAYLKGNFNEFDAKGKTPQELSDAGDIDSGLSGLIRASKSKGFSGLIIRNLDDAVGVHNRPADHYIVFDPERIKSADPVTYDKQKKPIPLEKRFDSSNPDIRY